MSAEMLEVRLLGAGTVLRLERDALSMVRLLRQETHEHVSGSGHTRRQINPFIRRCEP